jgi:LETM1 and EF-hand domain-containing protein 1
VSVNLLVLITALLHVCADRLVPFILIIMLFEETLPLVVIFAPFMLPSTTVLPSQAERIYAKREEKKAQALSTARWYTQHEKLDIVELQTLGVEDLSNDMAWTLCRFVLCIR